MPTDYKSRATRTQKKSLPGYIWLLSGLAIGLFVAFIVYLDKQPASDVDFGSAVQAELVKLKQKTSNKNNSTATQISAEPVKKKEPKFNFYTLLPRSKPSHRARLQAHDQVQPLQIKTHGQINNMFYRLVPFKI